MLELYVWLNKLLKREEGQGLVEYALIIFLVAIVVVFALTALGNEVSTIFGNITTSLRN